MISKMLSRILCYSGENLLLGARWKHLIIYVWVITMYMGITICMGIIMIHVKQDDIPYWCPESMIATDDDSWFFTQQHVGQYFPLANSWRFFSCM